MFIKPCTTWLSWQRGSDPYNVVKQNCLAALCLIWLTHRNNGVIIVHHEASDSVITASAPTTKTVYAATTTTPTISIIAATMDYYYCWHYYGSRTTNHCYFLEGSVSLTFLRLSLLISSLFLWLQLIVDKNFYSVPFNSAQNIRLCADIHVRFMLTGKFMFQLTQGDIQ